MPAQSRIVLLTLPLKQHSAFFQKLLTRSILPPLLAQFGYFIGVEFAQAQFDRGKKMCPHLDEHQGFDGGFDRALPSIDRMDIVNDINACCEFLGDQSARDAASFLWRARRWKRPQQDPV
jgi:hypothetical protein